MTQCTHHEPTDRGGCQFSSNPPRVQPAGRQDLAAAEVTPYEVKSRKLGGSLPASRTARRLGHHWMDTPASSAEQHSRHTGHAAEWLSGSLCPSLPCAEPLEKKPYTPHTAHDSRLHRGHQSCAHYQAVHLC